MTALTHPVGRSGDTQARDWRRAKSMVVIARVTLVLSMLALVGAWVATARGGPLLGLSQEHLFRDAAVLALLGIAFLMDSFVHRDIG